MRHSDAKSMLSPTSVQARRPPARNRSAASEQKARDSVCLSSRTMEVTAWAQSSAMPSSRSSTSFVPAVPSSRFTPVTQTNTHSVTQTSTQSSLEDIATKVPQSSSMILPPSRFAGKTRAASQSDMIGASPGLAAAISSIASGSRHITPRMSFRGMKKDESSGIGGFESSFQVVEARPSQVPAKGLHAYLGGKDPLQVLGELADDIDMSATSTIGKGHFGEVKRARRRRDGLCVAVKFIPLQEVGPSVRREVQAMHDLEQHPSLIHLVDVYVCRRFIEESQCDSPYICIVTEFIEGAEPLARRISVGGAQPSLASHVIPQLSEPLAFVHQRGYVHRDVWSENILLKSSGHVILVDFGASVRHDTGEIVTDRLNIPYAAPESSHRARQGPGEDCWAVGLLTSEIVTGQFLCDRIGTSTIPAYQKSRVMSEVKTETASIGGAALGTLCADLLHFDPASRPAMKDVKSYFNAATSSSSCKGTGAYRLERPSMSGASTQEPSPASTPAAAWPPQVPRLPTPTPSKCQSSLRHSLPDSSIKLPQNCSKLIIGDSTGHDLDSKIASALSYIDDPLEAGVQISYIARSNGMSYTGVVEGRSCDDNSWRLALHCGESKVVPDSDAWRISRIR